MAKPAATVVVLENKFKGAHLSGDALVRAAMAGGQTVETFAKINAERKFSAKATQTLAGSIQTTLDKADGNSAYVNVGPTVVYGRIHELGGIIKPVIAKTLHWINDAGEHVFAKLVKIPARPYLRPAVDEHMNEISEAMNITIKNEIESRL